MIINIREIKISPKKSSKEILPESWKWQKNKAEGFDSVVVVVLTLNSCKSTTKSQPKILQNEADYIKTKLNP